MILSRIRNTDTEVGVNQTRTAANHAPCSHPVRATVTATVRFSIHDSNPTHLFLTTHHTLRSSTTSITELRLLQYLNHGSATHVLLRMLLLPILLEQVSSWPYVLACTTENTLFPLRTTIIPSAAMFTKYTPNPLIRNLTNGDSTHKSQNFNLTTSAGGISCRGGRRFCRSGGGVSCANGRRFCRCAGRVSRRIGRRFFRIGGRDGAHDEGCVGEEVGPEGVNVESVLEGPR